MLQHCPNCKKENPDKFCKNLSMIKMYEDAIENNLSLIKMAAKENAGIESVALIKAFDPDITDKDLENKYSEIYFNIKIAFFNKGFAIGAWRSSQGSKIFRVRYITPDDRCPTTIDDLKPDKLIITKDVIKAMEELKYLTFKDRLEHGFTLLYGEDHKLFPTGLNIGTTERGILGDVPTEGYIIFGWVHTHFWSTNCDSEFYMTEKNIEMNFNITPSDEDVMISIDLYLDEKEFNHAIMIILSNLGDKGLIFVPNKNVPDKNYRDIYNLLKKKYIAYADLLNLISEVYHMIEFNIPSTEDIIIDQNILYS